MNRLLRRHGDSQPRLRTHSTGLPVSGGTQDSEIRRITSADLFEVGAVVEIEHDGEIYRLRHTRKGKLILTK